MIYWYDYKFLLFVCFLFLLHFYLFSMFLNSWYIMSYSLPFTPSIYFYLLDFYHRTYQLFVYFCGYNKFILLLFIDIAILEHIFINLLRCIHISMTPGSLAAKEKVIDHMEDMFHEKLKSFTSDVSS